jgi:hypothetical protein
MQGMRVVPHVGAIVRVRDPAIGVVPGRFV